MTESSTLVLEIARQDKQLAMSIFEGKEIVQTIKHYSQLSLSFTEIGKLCREVISILNKAHKKGALEADAVSSLKKTGQMLWDHLLTRSVKDRLKTTLIRNLVLSIDEELINIPWELLYTGEEFLCLKFNLGRLLRSREQMALPQYRGPAGRLKMLILANPTNDLKSAYLEGVYIKDQFDRKRKEMNIDFKSTHIDTLYVKKNLRDYDIVHFAGHCEYDIDNPKNTGWVLSDGRFTSSDILTLGESLPLPTLVFSNACHSAKVKTDLMDADCQEKNYSLASAFIFSGVRHYVGAIWKIEDSISLKFAREFYTQLIRGNSVGECVRLSRLKSIEEYGLTAISWASYILYGNPNFILFRQESKPQILRFKRDVSLYKKRIIKFVLAGFIAPICIYLYTWLPTLNPGIYLAFLKSHKLYLAGRNEEAILLGSSLIKKDPLFLLTYPLLANTYQRIGDKEKALRYYFEYALYSEKKNHKKDLSCAYIGIGWIYHGQGEYSKAFDFYNKAVTLSRENKDKLNEACALRKLAVWYMDKENYDKALELLMRSSEINRERQNIYEHRYNLACDYFDTGLLFTNKDDFNTAKEFYAKSLRIFKKLKLKNELSDYYFNLGEICVFEKQYHKALDYYMQGFRIDEAQGNKPSIASDYNMLGELHLEMDNFETAERFFNQTILASQQISVPLELASAYYNLGILYKKRHQRDKAREYLVQAQEIYIRIDTPDCEKVKKELLELAKN